MAYNRIVNYQAQQELVRKGDIENNCVAKTFPAERAPTARVKFSPDGRCIAAGYAINKIIIWDVETGNMVLLVVVFGKNIQEQLKSGSIL